MFQRLPRSCCKNKFSRCALLFVGRVLLTDRLLVNKFHNVFDVKRGPPFLIIFIQSAGYVILYLRTKEMVLINVELCIS